MQIEEIVINGIILHVVRNSNLIVVSSFVQNSPKFLRSFSCRRLSNLWPISRHGFRIKTMFFSL